LIYAQKQMKDSGKPDAAKVNLLNDIDIAWTVHDRSKQANIET